MNTLTCTIVLTPSSEVAPIERNLLTDTFSFFIGFACAYDRATYIPNHPCAFKQFYHMHLISDCRPKKGDCYYILSNDPTAVDANDIHMACAMEYSDICCKVEATTNPQLENIPRIPESLVVQYLTSGRAHKSVNLKAIYSEGKDTVTVNESKEVIVVEKKSDKSYSREEVVNLLNKFFKALGEELEIIFKAEINSSKNKSETELSVYDEELEKWIEDNV